MVRNIEHTVLSEELGGVECHTPHAVHSDGTFWAVWQGYRADNEGIYARSLHGGERSPIESLTPSGGRHHSPHIGLVQGTPSCVWIAQDSSKSYTVVGSSRANGGWSESQSLGSKGFVVELHADSADGRMAAVWCEATNPGEYAIKLVVNKGNGWSDPIDVTASSGWVQRPEVAVTEDGCWVVWDAYDGEVFAVHAAFVDGEGVVVTREVVSDRAVETDMVTNAAWQLAPSIAMGADGTPWVGWLGRQEVVSDTNVLDQWPVARVARRVGDRWELVKDSNGSPDLGVLAWGMLEWQGLGVWGYLGRRRKPLLVASPDGSMWLLWERKELCNGSTTTAQGVLLGRSIDPTIDRDPPRVSDTRHITTGPRYYTPVVGAKSNDELWVTGRVTPEISTEDVILAPYSLADAPAFVDEGPWHGWSPVSVDEPQLQPRPSVQVMDQAESPPEETSSSKQLSLYWADLHVHSTHSADAEGHVDELIAYARDLAHLDCVAFSNNDKHLLSITNSEYDLDYHFARHFAHLDDLVLLPAFEWSQMSRATGQRTSNHRTVIAGDEDLPLLRYTEVEGEPLAALAAHAEQYGAILHPHHEHWQFLSDSATETNMEVCSGWRVHMLDPVYREKIHGVLDRGRKLGFIGCSDGHRRTAGTGGGLTGIYAEELTRPAILDALRQHRCFATDGSRIAVQLWASDVFMGGSGRTDASPEICWKAQLTGQPATVKLLRDGMEITSWQADSLESSGRYTDADAAPGPHYYYLWVEQSMGWRSHLSNVAPAWGPRAWSSPVWLELV
jgi:hypothetical protein